MTPVAVRMTLLDVEIIIRDSATENRSLFYFVFCHSTLSKAIVCDNATKNRRPLTGMRGRDRAEEREEGRKGAGERDSEREKRGGGKSEENNVASDIDDTNGIYTYGICIPRGIQTYALCTCQVRAMRTPRRLRFAGPVHC
jgi:hypothetical protein